MEPERNAAELTIISAAQMRRYAMGALPPKTQAAAEKTLLTDDRARAVVLEETAHIPRTALPAQARDALHSSARRCAEAWRTYKALSRSRGASAPTRFAETLAKERWRLRQELLRLTASAQNDADRAAATQLAATDSGDIKPRFATALACDNKLKQTLHDAFEQCAAPKWKTIIAGWIAEISESGERLRWLQLRPANLPHSPQKW